MNLSEIIASEPVLTLAAGVGGAVWAALGSSAWFRGRRARLRRCAIQLIETAVRQVYEEYVRALKAGRADGKLTDAERRRARELARRRALALAGEAGVALADILGRAQIDLWIERSVRRLKRGA